MWFLRSFWAFAVVMLLSVGLCRAQERVIVLLDTNLPESTVYADSMRLGPASQGTFQIPADTRQLRLVPPGGALWTIAPVTAPLSLSAGDTLELHLSFPYHYQIETIPYGASVYLETLDGRTTIGETPVLYKSPQIPVGPFIIERRGNIPVVLTPGQEVWNRYVLTLDAVRIEDVESAEMAWRPPRKRRLWIDYTAAAVAVAAGAVSIHYKFKADRLNEQYEQTGDSALRPRIHDLDTRAGVALGVMQVGVGVLALRFILR